MTQSVLEVLKTARDVVESNWCQNYLTDPFSGGHCAIGAVQVAAGKPTYMTQPKGVEAKAINVLANVVPADWPTPHWLDEEDPAWVHKWNRVADYNNEHSHAEVIDLFNRAIASVTPVVALPVSEKVEVLA